MKDFNDILKTKINQLPQLEPKPQTWEAIFVHLKFREKLSTTAQKLPNNEPTESGWCAIEESLNKKQQTHKIPKVRNLVIDLSVAASIALFISTYFLFNNSNQDTITISEEIINEWESKSAPESDVSAQSAVRFIENQCKQNTFICSAPDFNEKKKQLDEINSQINEINEIISTTGNSPTIQKSLIKLENVRARLVKDLINQITS